VLNSSLTHEFHCGVPEVTMTRHRGH